MQNSRYIIVLAIVISSLFVCNTLLGQERESEIKRDGYSGATFRKEIRRIEGLLAGEGYKELASQLDGLLESAAKIDDFRSDDDRFSGMIARLGPLFVTVRPKKFAYLYFDVSSQFPDPYHVVAIIYFASEEEVTPTLREEELRYYSFHRKISDRMWFYSRPEPGA